MGNDVLSLLERIRVLHWHGTAPGAARPGNVGEVCKGSAGDQGGKGGSAGKVRNHAVTPHLVGKVGNARAKCEFEFATPRKRRSEITHIPRFASRRPLEQQHRGARNSCLTELTPVGLEPTIPGSAGRCLIHWATGPCELRQADTSFVTTGVSPTGDLLVT